MLCICLVIHIYIYIYIVKNKNEHVFTTQQQQQRHNPAMKFLINMLIVTIKLFVSVSYIISSIIISLSFFGCHRYQPRYNLNARRISRARNGTRADKKEIARVYIISIRASRERSKSRSRIIYLHTHTSPNRACLFLLNDENHLLSTITSEKREHAFVNQTS